MKRFALVLAVLALLALPVCAITEFIGKDQTWMGFISSKTAGQNTNWYTRASYTNAHLGTYSSSEDLFLHVYRALTFTGEEEPAVWACTYYYAVYPSNQNPTTFAYGDFKTLDGVWIADIVEGTQEWGRTTNNPVNLDLSLAAGQTNGDYVLALYGVFSNGFPAQVSDGLPGGETYNAFFTLIPEPVSALVVGAALFVIRRRQ